MTQPLPYYTATSTATAGPADPNASGRAKAYAVLSGLLGLVPVLSVFGVITGDQGTAIGNAVQAFLGLIGAFGLGIAAKKTSTQVKEGTFDPAPQLPAVPALEQLAILRDQAAAEVERNVAAAQAGVDAIQASATAVAQSIGVPTQVTGIANAGTDLVQQLIERVGRQGR
ncbi:holin [Mycobacterium phage Taptic]|uniref:Holin n=1 Tax=Mycobacterium phage Taptic TaxID=1920305 RepID=A0A1J0ME18_9CAUD|nr:holin [Mycobacterium phage Taptic]APD19267.1 holin [Mycobacterium phage Taptic]AVO21347.1 holin [Mycobacterium phage Megabear]WRQ08217.1 holin [Mycobacterium phage harman]BBC28561.1 putative holin [Mycobacterium phage D12]